MHRRKNKLPWILAVACLGLATLVGMIWCCNDGRIAMPTDAATVPPADTQGVASTVPGPGLADPTTSLATEPRDEAPVAADTPGTLLVHARTGAGAPVPDAEVRVAAKQAFNPWLEERTATTDAAGSVRLQLPAGDYSVTSARGGSAQVAVTAGELQEAWLRIEASFTIAGQVVDTGGQAVEGASIWLSRGDSISRGAEVARSGPDGSFRIDAVVGDRLLAASHPDFAPSYRLAVGSRAGDVAGVHVVLHRAHGTLRGLVVDAAGRPVAGATILLGRERPRQGPAPRLLTSDAEGHFGVAALAPGSHELCIRKAGFGLILAPFEVRAGAPADVRVVLGQGASVHGTVRDSRGAPVPGARVYCGERGTFACLATAADGAGQYLLAGLPAGAQDLTALGADGATQSTRLRLPEGGVAEWHPLLADLADTATLHGMLTDPRGQPLAGWQVQAVDLGTDGRSVASTARPDGRFMLPGLSPQATVQLRARRPGHGYGELPDATLDQVPVRQFTGNGSEVAFVVADGQDSRGTLRAEVLGPDGKPVAARLDIWHEDRRCFGQYPAPHGRFALELPAGALRIEVQSDGLPTERLPPCTLPAGAALDLGRVRLQRGAVVFGDVTGPDGRAPIGLVVAVLRADESVPGVDCAAGSFRSAPLQPGDYTLLVRADGCAPLRQPLRLVAGEQHQLDCTLQGGVIARVRVDVPTGADTGNALGVAAFDAEDRLLWQGGLRLDQGEREGSLWLGGGSYRIVAWARRGWRGEGRIVVEPGVPPAPLAIALKQ